MGKRGTTFCDIGKQMRREAARKTARRLAPLPCEGQCPKGVLSASLLIESPKGCRCLAETDQGAIEVIGGVKNDDFRLAFLWEESLESRV